MCGITAIHTNSREPDEYLALRKLFYQSKIRGLHSFGFATSDGKFAKYYNLEECLEGLPLIGTPQQIAAHTRYCQSGDWKDMRNNHPIVVEKGRMMLLFNGVISMKTTAEYKLEYPYEFETENDGEIFMRWVLSGSDPSEFVRKMKGSFAGVYFLDGCGYAIRNERRPLWYCNCREGTAFVASTRDMFVRSQVCQQPIPLQPGKLFALKDLAR